MKSRSKGVEWDRVKVVTKIMTDIETSTLKIEEMMLKKRRELEMMERLHLEMVKTQTRVRKINNG